MRYVIEAVQRSQTGKIMNLRWHSLGVSENGAPEHGPVETVSVEQAVKVAEYGLLHVKYRGTAGSSVRTSETSDGKKQLCDVPGVPADQALIRLPEFEL